MTPAHEQELELYESLNNTILESAVEYGLLVERTNNKELNYKEIISDLQQKNLDLQREKTKLLADREIANSIIVSLTNLLNASREGTESLVCFKRLRN